jgi:hypothetical protein
LHSNRRLGLTINKPLLIDIFKTKNLASLPIIQEGIHFEDPLSTMGKNIQIHFSKKCFYCGKDNHVLKDYYKWKVDETNGVFRCNNPNKKKMFYIVALQAQTNSTIDDWIVGSSIT